jgi:ATP-binding cassette subfamily F protein 3
MDIVGKETLEEMLSNFSGTVIFVSHDRYFIKKIATKVLDFKSGETMLYPFGYEQYLEKQKAPQTAETVKTEKTIKEKKNYTTPAKEKARLERAVKKAEEKIAILEERLGGLETELTLEENISDYIKLGELQREQEELETELDAAMNEWERFSEELSNISI